MSSRHTVGTMPNYTNSLEDCRQALTDFAAGRCQQEELPALARQAGEIMVHVRGVTDRGKNQEHVQDPLWAKRVAGIFHDEFRRMGLVGRKSRGTEAFEAPIVAFILEPLNSN